MTIEQLKREYIDAYTMNCKPNITKLHKGFITDPDMSVNWNIQQVEENNKQYLEEVKQLNKLKNEAIHKSNSDIVKYISKKLHITKDNAQKIWNFIHNEYIEHYDRYYSVLFEKLDDLITLLEDVYN